MTTVTVGVPVYNGAAQLAECLECLVGQTWRDLAILVYDNASTDATPDIARRFEARDSRVRLVRRPANIKAMPNFVGVVQDCATPLMLWRAHDDLSSPDYVERLHAALAATPGAGLAVPTVRTLRRNGQVRVAVPRAPTGRTRLGDVLGLLFGSQHAWFYGLWRTAVLRPTLEAVWAAFPNGWASDHLTLYPLLLDRAVAFAPEAVFVQRHTRKAYSPGEDTRPPLEAMRRLRAGFLAQARAFLDERPFTMPERMALEAATYLYTGKRVYRLRSLLARQWLGDRGPTQMVGDF